MNNKAKLYTCLTTKEFHFSRQVLIVTVNIVVRMSSSRTNIVGNTINADIIQIEHIII